MYHTWEFLYSPFVHQGVKGDSEPGRIQLGSSEVFRQVARQNIYDTFLPDIAFDWMGNLYTNVIEIIWLPRILNKELEGKKWNWDAFCFPILFLWVFFKKHYFIFVSLICLLIYINNKKVDKCFQKVIMFSARTDVKWYRFKLLFKEILIILSRAYSIFA